MKKLLLIALAALSFGTASAYEHDGVWTWDGVAAPQLDKNESFTGYIRNVQTGEFLATASTQTVVDNGIDDKPYSECNAGIFKVFIKEGRFGQKGYVIQNSNNKYITWGGFGYKLKVNADDVDKFGVGNLAKWAYLEFSEDGTPSTGYKIFYGGITEPWYLYLNEGNHKTLEKSGKAHGASPYVYWQFISQDEMEKYHEYKLDHDVLDLYNTTMGSDIKHGHEYTNIYVHRQLKAGYNTIALPFDVTDVEAAFGEGAYVSKFTGAEVVDGASYTLTFTKQKNIEANVPYILHLNADTPEVTTFENTTAFSEVSQSVAFAGWTFQSNYLPNQSMEGKYGVVNSTAKIMRGEGEKAIINGLTAYFTFNGTALNSVQAIFVDGQGELTDIQQLEPVATENGQTIYTISGQRVNNAVNGINIINGRKVLKK